MNLRLSALCLPLFGGKKSRALRCKARVQAHRENDLCCVKASSQLSLTKEEGKHGALQSLASAAGRRRRHHCAGVDRNFPRAPAG
jgi:hypothetical protein